jgi:hypothetical protein
MPKHSSTCVSGKEAQKSRVNPDWEGKMLYTLHMSYSEQVLSGLRLSNSSKEQIITGSTNNDFCEMTNEYQFLRRIKKFIGLKGVEDIALYQSHYGRLASLHFMSKDKDEPAGTTQGELFAWFDFLNEVALGSCSLAPHQLIAEDQKPVSNMLTGTDITYIKIFDTGISDEIKSRALGMMLHLIQDSYTFSHCERNDNNQLIKFFHYASQNKKRHQSGDIVQSDQEGIMLDQCRDCVQSVLSGKKYDYSNILILSNDTQASDAGPFA